jgi:hypothetical protein
MKQNCYHVITDKMSGGEGKAVIAAPIFLFVQLGN